MKTMLKYTALPVIAGLLVFGSLKAAYGEEPETFHRFADVCQTVEDFHEIANSPSPLHTMRDKFKSGDCMYFYGQSLYIVRKLDKLSPITHTNKKTGQSQECTLWSIKLMDYTVVGQSCEPVAEGL